MFCWPDDGPIRLKYITVIKYVRQNISLFDVVQFLRYCLCNNEYWYGIDVGALHRNII
jgi:hypothetical protein